MKQIKLSLLFLLILAMILAGCSREDLPALPKLPVAAPDLSKLPGIPKALSELPGLLEELGLPDLSQIANLPKLEDLPGLQTPPGAQAFSGPMDRQIKIGERVPGTDIVLTAINGESADFQIAGLHSPRTVGDSLDFDGPWPGLSGTTYALRLRIYRVGSDNVRAAGVNRLVVNNIQATEDNSSPTGFTIKFPFTSGIAAGEKLLGTTIGYVGTGDRGGQLSGLPANDYPYRKTGDSITWTGHIRPDIAANYNLRMLLYSADRAQVGGIVTIALPNQ
ncbi:hypothetical protein BH10CHL1_BH10CHL1_18340 [soil metagenome]